MLPYLSSASQAGGDPLGTAPRAEPSPPSRHLRDAARRWPCPRGRHRPERTSERRDYPSPRWPRGHFGKDPRPAAAAAARRPRGTGRGPRCGRPCRPRHRATGQVGRFVSGTCFPRCYRTLPARMPGAVPW